MYEDLKNKIVIVTGAGGRGIGRATSLAFCQEGAKVVVVDVNEEGGRETLKMIEEKGGEGIFVKANVMEKEDIENLVKEVIGKYGKIDILVNNAGGAKGLTLLEIDEETIEYNLRENLIGPMLCTKAVLPYMIKQRKGVVIFVSTINALWGGFSETAYATAKSGLHSLAQTLVADYSQYGIRFNVVCPGTIRSFSKTWQKREKERPGTMERLNKLYPLGRIGEPEDVANAILFLASEKASWITGVILPVDGGITATGHLPGGKWWEKI